MKKFKALVTAEVIPEILDKISDKIDFKYDGYCLNHDVMPHNELIEKIRDYDILICEYDTIDREVFDNANNLKIIICCRGGIKSVVDLEYAMEKNVIVCNNAGRNANAVSDMTIAYILNLTRNISKTNDLIHNRIITSDISSKPDEYQDTVWGLDNESPFIKYRGKSINYMTLGLVGFGHAGKLVAKKANVFGMNIIAYDPYVDDGDVPDYVKMVSWDKLLHQSDIISVHSILTPQTRNMFSENVFDEMKYGSYFINTSRGELVDENAMINALKSGHLAGAAIDVTTKEPISSDSFLINAPNLIITPHIAGSSYDVLATGSNMVLDSLTKWLNGEKPQNCIIYR